MHARRTLSALAAGSALLGLSACEAPAPIVTLYSGDTSLYDEAFVYCFDDQDPEKEAGADGACRFDAEREAQVLQVTPGDTVLVDVDKDLADAAWFVSLTPEGGEAVRVSDVEVESHTARVLPDFSQGVRQTLEVRKLASEEEGAPVTGLWRYTLVPQT